MESLVQEAIIEYLLICIAVGLIVLAIQIAIIQYLIRYGINYYFRMKSMNEPETLYLDKKGSRIR